MRRDPTLPRCGTDWWPSGMANACNQTGISGVLNTGRALSNGTEVAHSQYRERSRDSCGVSTLIATYFKTDLCNLWIDQLFAVNHPRDAETIGAHPKARGPERLPKRHDRRSTFGQCVEDAFALTGIVERERN